MPWEFTKQKLFVTFHEIFFCVFFSCVDALAHMSLRNSSEFACVCVCAPVCESQTQRLALRKRSLSGSDPHRSAWKKCFAKCRTFSTHSHACTLHTHTHTNTHQHTHDTSLKRSGNTQTHKGPLTPNRLTGNAAPQHEEMDGTLAHVERVCECACACVCVCVCGATLVHEPRPNTTFGTICAGIGHLLLGCATHGPMRTHSRTAAM